MIDSKSAARIRSKSQPKGDGCVVWIGSVNHKGYGQVWFEGSMKQVHRVVYEAVWGPIPEGDMVLHLCDEPACVNPDHLRTGTARDNAQDRDRKGRGQRGERHFNAKLDANKVREIRKRYAEGEAVKALAREFGVTYRAALDACHRRSWKHVA